MRGEQAAGTVTDTRLAAYEKLHDRLSDMIESGRLHKGDIPDDYDWLVNTLAGLLKLEGA